MRVAIAAFVILPGDWLAASHLCWAATEHQVVTVVSWCVGQHVEPEPVPRAVDRVAGLELGCRFVLFGWAGGEDGVELGEPGQDAGVAAGGFLAE